MSQSLVSIYLHIIFSTKHRQPFITSEIEPVIHEYLGGICNNLNCQVIIAGGYTDHVHILCKLGKAITVVDLVKKVKANSSKWVKTKGIKYSDFYWQDGYGAFSVSPKEVKNVIRYIENQHEHHRKISFQDEYRQILNEQGL